MAKQLTGRSAARDQRVRQTSVRTTKNRLNESEFPIYYRQIFPSLPIEDQFMVLCDCIRKSLLTAVCLLVALSAQAKADELVMVGSANSAGGTVQIDGGAKQETKNWPATLKYLVAGKFTCTSTIVGERSVITAAHCLPDGTTARVEIGDKKFNLTCTLHPHFNRDTLEFDVALCFSKDPFPNTIGYENLDVKVTRVSVGSTLFLLGYGCRDVNSQVDFGQLYGGSATVFQLAPSPGTHIRTHDGVVICPGDSGGSAYVLASQDQPVSPRSIIGINSGYAALTRVSAITPLTGDVAGFIRDWADDRKTTICGVHSNVLYCHDRFVP